LNNLSTLVVSLHLELTLSSMNISKSLLLLLSWTWLFWGAAGRTSKSWWQPGAAFSEWSCTRGEQPTPIWN